MLTEILPVQNSALTSAAVEFDPFAGPELARICLTTAPQAEIWLACLLGGDDASRAYNESVSLEFTGRVDRAALQQAVQEAVRRHEALRSAFSPDGKYMCVFEAVAVDIAYQDVATQSSSDKQRRLDELLAADAHHVFDLLRGPLIRFSLLRLEEERYHFLVTAHHIICDGWSTGVLLQDVGTLYSAYAQRLPVLPPAVAFSAYAHAQHLYEASPDYARTEQFWVGQHAPDTPPLELPLDFPRPASRTYKSDRLDFPLAPGLAAKLKKTGLQAGCSLVTTLMTCFEVLLHRLSGQPTVVVGLPAAGQSATGSHHLVGHCVNLLPLKSTIHPADSFHDVLRQRKMYLFDAYDHQRVTFGSVLQKIAIRRDTSRVPLVPVMFNMDLGLAGGIEFHNLQFQLQSNPRAFEAFELFLNASGFEHSLILEWSYNVALFKPETIGGMMATLEQIIEEVTQDPQTKINALASQPALLIPQAYITLNNTFYEYDSTTPIHLLIDQQARQQKNKTAVRFQNNEFTYQEVSARSNQLAHFLKSQSIGRGDIVGISLDRSAEMLLVLLAVLKCGAAYLPLDPTFPADRLNFMAADSGASLIITSDKNQISFQTNTECIYLEDSLRQAESFSRENLNSEISGEDIMYVLYTSGSTGLPKGVQVTHQNALNFMQSMQREPGLSAADRLLAITTISFDIAGLELFLPLLCGATVIIAEKQAVRDGRVLLDLLTEEGITVMQATPSTWRMMLEAGWTQKLPLKILCGGEALPLNLAEELLARCNSLWNMYGPTETTIWSSAKEISKADKIITIGKPIANTQFYILDESTRLVEPGETGELYIAGAGIAKGYLNRPELNESRFVRNLFSVNQENKMYRTGDLVRLSGAGDIEYMGRADQQIKIRGYRVEPGEIEHLLTAWPEILEAVVVAKGGAATTTTLAAYVVLNLEHSPTDSPENTAKWKRKLAETLPAYMIPAEFTVLAALPKTLNGKIDRAALTRQPNPEKAAPALQWHEPRTNIEKTVSDIWKSCLQLTELSIFDDFFTLGGHSLLAVQVMAQLEKQTGKRLPLSTLFENSTVEKLAAVLEMDSQFITWNSLVPIKPHGTKVPLYIVHGAGLNVLIFNALAKNMDSDQPVYGLQAKGLNGIDEPLGSIEEMATHYIAAIAAVNPEGPYALAGYSFGGIIAYEMARQLKSAGKQVNILVMFDTYADQPNHFQPLTARIANRLIFPVKRWIYTLLILAKSPSQTLEYKAEAAKRTLDRLRYNKEKYHESTFGHPYKIGLMQEVAANKYCLVPDQIKVNLFRAKVRTFFMNDFEYLGWKPFALQGVETHEIPGDHNYMFAPPNDKEVAKILQKVLDINQ